MSKYEPRHQLCEEVDEEIQRYWLNPREVREQILQPPNDGLAEVLYVKPRSDLVTDPDDLLDFDLLVRSSPPRSLFDSECG